MEREETGGNIVGLPGGGILGRPGFARLRCRRIHERLTSEDFRTHDFNRLAEIACFVQGSVRPTDFAGLRIHSVYRRLDFAQGREVAKGIEAEEL